jgi:hypothetical protein
LSGLLWDVILKIKGKYMPQTQVMSLEERAAIIIKAMELKKQGKLEESKRMMKQIPLPAFLAKFARDYREYFGDDFLEKYGWNLSEAEAEFGSDWLTR